MLCPVDVRKTAEWVSAIPSEDWPQQSRMTPDSLYPAMIATHRADWHDVTTTVQPLIDECLRNFPGGRRGHSMLSILVPGQSIEGHTDVQSPAWRARVHIPLVTNDSVWFCQKGERFRMPIGAAYLFNPEIEHTVHNEGTTNRVHLFFDVLED